MHIYYCKKILKYGVKKGHSCNKKAKKNGYCLMHTPFCNDPSF